MGTVIYAASPMQAFLGAAGTILALLALGLGGLGWAALQRKRNPGIRIAMGAAGGLLLLAGAAYAVVTLTSATGPTQSIALSLDNKRIVEDNCGDNGETCTRYVLEATTSTNAFDFDVPRQAYDQAQVNACYQFTYYASKGLFGDNNGAYQRIDKIARIETADPSRCQ